MKRILLLWVACASRVLTLSDTGCCRPIGPQSGGSRSPLGRCRPAAPAALLVAQTLPFGAIAG